jgi:hypothetical protein
MGPGTERHLPSFSKIDFPYSGGLLIFPALFVLTMSHLF